MAGRRLGSTLVAASFDCDEPGALSAVPDAGELVQAARLTFFYGPMDCGKSTLALCRAHHRRGDLGPVSPSGQVTLDVEAHRS